MDITIIRPGDSETQELAKMILELIPKYPVIMQFRCQSQLKTIPGLTKEIQKIPVDTATNAMELAKFLYKEFPGVLTNKQTG